MQEILYKCKVCIWTGTIEQAEDKICPDCTEDIEPLHQTLEALHAKAERRKLNGIKPTRQQIDKLYERVRKNM